MSDYEPKYPKEAAIFPGELAAIKIVVELADTFGYGNLIHHLKCAWSQKLRADPDSPHSALTADMASGLVCVWCRTDTRTGEEVSE